jgi:cytochrome c1
VRLAQKPYRALLICHSMGEHHIGTLRTMALRAGVRSYWIEPMTPPETLIGNMRALLQGAARVECGSEKAGAGSSQGPAGRKAIA